MKIIFLDVLLKCSLNRCRYIWRKNDNYSRWGPKEIKKIYIQRLKSLSFFFTGKQCGCWLVGFVNSSALEQKVSFLFWVVILFLRVLVLLAILVVVLGHRIWEREVEWELSSCCCRLISLWATFRAGDLGLVISLVDLPSSIPPQRL